MYAKNDYENHAKIYVFKFSASKTVKMSSVLPTDLSVCVKILVAE